MPGGDVDEADEADDPATPRPGAFRPRGRHRRPRPRKAVLAAGGLAFAAGVLGLLRMTPDPGSGGPVTGAAALDGGTTGTGYGQAGGGEAGGEYGAGEGYDAGVTDLATDAAAMPVASTGPGDTRSTSEGAAASPGTDPRHPPHTSGVPRPSAPAQSTPEVRATPTPPPGTPTYGTSPTPTPTPTVVPPGSHPAPAPAPSPTTPTPGTPHGLCIPAIGLCVDTPFANP